MWEYFIIALLCFFGGYYVGWIVHGKWEVNKYKFVKANRANREAKKNDK